MTQEALELALEALRNYAWHGEACPQHPTYSKPENYPKCTCGYDKAITAIKEALAQQPTQQRKPLTDEQIFVIKHNWITTPFANHLDFARAIEAAHGIKENT